MRARPRSCGDRQRRGWHRGRDQRRLQRRCLWRHHERPGDPPTRPRAIPWATVPRTRAANPCRRRPGSSTPRRTRAPWTSTPQATACPRGRAGLRRGVRLDHRGRGRLRVELRPEGADPSTAPAHQRRAHPRRRRSHLHRGGRPPRAPRRRPSARPRAGIPGSKPGRPRARPHHPRRGRRRVSPSQALRGPTSTSTPSRTATRTGSPSPPAAVTGCSCWRATPFSRPSPPPSPRGTRSCSWPRDRDPGPRGRRLADRRERPGSLGRIRQDPQVFTVHGPRRRRARELHGHRRRPSPQTSATARCKTPSSPPGSTTSRSTTIPRAARRPQSGRHRLRSARGG